MSIYFEIIPNLPPRIKIILDIWRPRITKRDAAYLLFNKDTNRIGNIQFENLANKINVIDYTRNVTMKQNLKIAYRIGRQTKLSK